jgi:hypothetical protein
VAGCDRRARVQEADGVEAHVDHDTPAGRVLADESPPDQELGLVDLGAGAPELQADLVVRVVAARERGAGQRPDRRVADEGPGLLTLEADRNACSLGQDDAVV